MPVTIQCGPTDEFTVIAAGGSASILLGAHEIRLSDDPQAYVRQVMELTDIVEELLVRQLTTKGMTR